MIYATPRWDGDCGYCAEMEIPSAKYSAIRKAYRRSGVKARSGTMISFWKAVRAARAAVREPALADAVEKALTDALAPAQRRKLEADRGR
jgi:hypothetical protein